jgi:hypothetical protein
MPLKTLYTSNLAKPEEHFAWALCNVPGIGPGPEGTSIPPAWAEAISKHLHELGFVFAPYLARKAGPDGTIHVDDLPKQTKKFLRPYRGDQTHYNPASQWVPMETEEPEPIMLPDVNQLTPQEREALLNQFRERGDLDPVPPRPNHAKVL